MRGILEYPIRKTVERALDEDIGHGEFACGALFPEGAEIRARILAKQEGVVAGLPVAELTLRLLDPNLAWKAAKEDGQKIGRGETVVELRGDLRAILMGERTALNFLQRMSGIATLTSKFVEAVAGLPVKILDTRKTAPGLRLLDKYAVRAGGGFNHRFGLHDGAMLKDNYIAAAGGIERAVRTLRERGSPTIKIEVEVENLGEVEQALRAGADIVMLDNMAVPEMAKAVELARGKAIVEASGGISLENVREVAATGVDLISVGALTHSVQALDLSLEVMES